MAIQKSNYSENKNTNGKISDDGKDANEKRCMKCIRNAAELGLAPAQFMLGECYEFGKNGFKQNKKEAVKWYRKAAEQKMAKAELKLESLYVLDDGVKKDKEKAEEWLFDALIHGEDDILDIL